MQNLMQKAKRLWRDEDGLVAIEYGLMATFIALAIVVGADALGDGLNILFQNIAECFNPAGATGTCPVDMTP